MWILKILPNFVFYLILLLGLAGIAASFVLKFIPFVTQYRVPILWASGIATAFGLYMAGAISDNDAWLARVKDLEKQVAVAEAKSNAANTELVSKIAQKDREIQAKQTELKTRIQQQTQSIDAQCVVSPSVISILNDAAKRPGDKK